MFSERGQGDVGWVLDSLFLFYLFPRYDGNERSSRGCCYWLPSNLRAQLSCARSLLQYCCIRSALRPVYGLYSLSPPTGQLSCWNSCCKAATSRCGTLCVVSRYCSSYSSSKTFNLGERSTIHVPYIYLRGCMVHVS